MLLPLVGPTEVELSLHCFLDLSINYNHYVAPTCGPTDVELSLHCFLDLSINHNHYIAPTCGPYRSRADLALFPRFKYKSQPLRCSHLWAPTVVELSQVSGWNKLFRFQEY